MGCSALRAANKSSFVSALLQAIRRAVCLQIRRPADRGRCPAQDVAKVGCIIIRTAGCAFLHRRRRTLAKTPQVRSALDPVHSWQPTETRQSTLDTRHSTLDTRHSTLDSRHSTKPKVNARCRQAQANDTFTHKRDAKSSKRRSDEMMKRRQTHRRHVKSRKRRSDEVTKQRSDEATKRRSDDATKLRSYEATKLRSYAATQRQSDKATTRQRDNAMK